MKTLSLIVLLAAISAFGLQTDSDQAIQKAQSSAEQWLKLVDSGDYDQSWRTASQMFKSHVSKEQWEKAMETTRSPFGQVLSRRVKKATYADHLPGAPDGDYVVIQYDTSFEHKKSAVETVTPMLDGGEWKISGYFIR
jgi:hypothetical protein